MRKFVLAAAALAAVSSSVFAASTTANFNVKVKIAKTCTITATDVDFGTVGAFDGTETATGTLSINCTNKVPYTLALNAPVVQAMTGATVGNIDTISYTLALASSSGTGNGSAQTVNMNGAVTTAQSVTADDYAQARVVTITY